MLLDVTCMQASSGLRAWQQRAQEDAFADDTPKSLEAWISLSRGVAGPRSSHAHAQDPERISNSNLAAGCQDALRTLCQMSCSAVKSCMGQARCDPSL